MAKDDNQQPATEAWIVERWGGNYCLVIGRNEDFMLDYTPNGQLILHVEKDEDYTFFSRLLLFEKPTQQNVIDAERMFGCIE